MRLRWRWGRRFCGDFVAARPVGGFVLSSVDVPRGAASIPHAGRPRTRMFRVGEGREGRTAGGRRVCESYPQRDEFLAGRGEILTTFENLRAFFCGIFVEILLNLGEFPFGKKIFSARRRGGSSACFWRAHGCAPRTQRGDAQTQPRWRGRRRRATAAPAERSNEFQHFAGL